MAFTDNGRNHTGRELKKWSKTVESLGAGEISIVFVDKDGTGKGMESDIIQEISKIINIPIIVNGGIGKLSQIVDIFKSCDISGISLSSILHYECVLQNSIEDNTLEGNRSFLSNKRKISNIETINLKNLKKQLFLNKINIRK